MAELIKTFFPWLVFLSNMFFGIAVLAYLGRNTWGRGFISWFGKHALPLAFFVALTAMLGSLSYSEVVGWEPCFLCWWQRIFIYPQVLILGLAWWRKDRGILFYAVVLAIVATLISIYHVNIQWGGFSLTPCPAVGPSCDKVFSKEFGYITLPMMALSTSVYIIGISLANRFYLRNENSNA